MNLEKRKSPCMSKRICAPRRSRLRAIVVTILALTLGIYHVVPAKADGTIYAVITLTNSTGAVITTSNPTTSTEWGISPPWLKYLAGLVMIPGGAPPGMVGPGAAMFWGSQSNGGFLATTGTGGSVFIPAANQTITWSVPWTAENLGPPFDGCNASVTGNGGSIFASDVVNFIGVGNAWGTATPDDKTCEFTFTVTPAPAPSRSHP
jgi:hypothetical protein